MTASIASGALQADGSIVGRADDGRARTSPRPCVYMASLPLDANVQFLTVMATKMPYIGRG